MLQLSYSTKNEALMLTGWTSMYYIVAVLILTSSSQEMPADNRRNQRQPHALCNRLWNDRNGSYVSLQPEIPLPTPQVSVSSLKEASIVSWRIYMYHSSTYNHPLPGSLSSELSIYMYIYTSRVVSKQVTTHLPGAWLNHR